MICIHVLVEKLHKRLLRAQSLEEVDEELILRHFHFFVIDHKIRSLRVHFPDLRQIFHLVDHVINLFQSCLHTKSPR